LFDDKIPRIKEYVSDLRQMFSFRGPVGYHHRVCFGSQRVEIDNSDSKTISGKENAAFVEQTTFF
jgi:hypothetical protein